MQIFHPNGGTDNESGFSLLELLVVLVITSVMLSLVSVRLIQSIESTQFIRTSHAAVSDIKILRAQAVLNSKPYVLITDDTSQALLAEIEEDTQRRLSLPENWRVSGSPVRVSSTGFCSGGQLTINDDKGRQVRYYMKSPKCVPFRDSNALVN